MDDTENGLASQKISREREEKLISRLYTQDLALKANRMEELDRRYYPMAPPITISEEKLKASISRQVDDEMQKRRIKQEEAAAAAQRPPGVARTSGGATAAHKGDLVGRPMTPGEVEASIERMYTTTIEKTKMKNKQLVEEQIKRERRNCLETKKMSREALQESVNRLSVPKKTTFTVEEINKMYGL